MPGKFFKTTATLVLFILSFVVLVDAFVCGEAVSGEAEEPVECCLQCCPRHNLVPPASGLEKARSISLLEKFPHFDLRLPVLLLEKSIFHPPKSRLS